MFGLENRTRPNTIAEDISAGDLPSEARRAMKGLRHNG
jgi:hypothetical protein